MDCFGNFKLRPTSESDPESLDCSHPFVSIRFLICIIKL